jgi:hypothetical protein
MLPPDTFRYGRAAVTNREGPKTFTANISVLAIEVAASRGRIAPAPALLTNTSRRPQRSITGSTVLEASSGFAASARMKSSLFVSILGQCLQGFGTAARYDHPCSSFSEAKHCRPPYPGAGPSNNHHFIF